MLEIIKKYRIPLSFKTIELLFGIFLVLFALYKFYISVIDGVLVWGLIKVEFAHFAWQLLLFMIFISLFSKIFSKIRIFKQLLPLRKYAGIAMFIATFLHAIFNFFNSNIFFDTPKILEFLFLTDWALTLGTIAFLICIPLFLTSSAWFIAQMGPVAWKRLHKVTHIVFVFSVLHIAFINFYKTGYFENGPLVLFAIYCLGYAYLFFKNRKK